MDIETVNSDLEDFLIDNYAEELEKVDGEVVRIHFSKLIKIHPEIGEYLIDNFSDFSLLINQKVSQLTEGRKKTCRIDGIISVSKDIWKLRSDDVGALVSIRGHVRKVGDVQHRILILKEECPSCGNDRNTYQQDDDHIRKANKCSCGYKGPFRFISRVLQDYKKIVVEEDAKNLLPTQKPRTILCVLRDDLNDASIDRLIQPSKRVEVVGVLKDKKVGKNVNDYRKYVDAHNLRIVDEMEDSLKVTKDDVREFHEMASSEDILDRIANSAFPTVVGYDDVKKALILSMIGGTHLYKDGELEERGLIHVFLAGGPGTSKSQLLKRAIQFVPGSRFSSGKLSSGVGLVASVSKDEEMGGYALDAGSVALASGAIQALDEADKIDHNDLAHLNNSMVDMKVVLNKANIHQTLITETTMMVAANPKNRVFDERLPAWQQISLPKDFMDRFDLVFPMIPPSDAKKQKDIADMVVGKYVDEYQKANPDIGKEKLTKYIGYARKVKTIMTRAASDCLSEEFMKITKPKDVEGEAKAYLSYRLLSNLVRLSQACAKVRLSEKVEEADAVKAVNILKASLKAQQIITDDGLYDYERGENIVPKGKRNKMLIIKSLIKSIAEEKKDKKVDVALELLPECEKAKMTPEDVEELLSRLHQSGDVYEPRRGYVSLVGE